jgi:acyl-homoserine lactone acylase PvdQ
VKLARILFLSLVFTTLAFGADPGDEVKIVRDDFGIPHIFSESDEGVSYGLGYAQAEDRLEELFKNYMRATGTMSEVFGKEHFRDDTIARIWRHAAISEEKYPSISEKSRGCIEAYQAGIEEYMRKHPEEVPEWAPELHPWQVVALGRYIIWGWPMGDAGHDLEQGGIEPDPLEYRGSNQWLIAPNRTADGAVLALVDPHLSWYGQFRFYEARMYGDTLKLSGVSILGSALPSLGHNEYCSVAMTTGSGDTSDVFIEKLNPDNPVQYEVDGEWRDMKVVKDTIRVKQEDGSIEEVEKEFHYTHHGPIVATKDGKGYAMAIPYFDDVGLTDQVYAMMTSKNLSEMKAAMNDPSLMGQNVMIGTVDGDIYYQRTGKIPIRAEGIDSRKPIEGHLSKNDWKGITPADKLVQVENPPQGYMQNCNVSPFAMMRNSPMRLADYPDYVYGTRETPPHQRAAMVVEILHNDDSVTVEEALDLAMNCEVYNADKWQTGLAEARKNAKDPSEDATKLNALISEWDRKSLPDSVGAIAYLYWKEALPKGAREGDRMGAPPPYSLSGAEMLEALETAAKKLKEDHGKLEVAYGAVYRVGRRGGEKTYPVGGGQPVYGMATPRAIGFDKAPDGSFVGKSGQTSTQVIQLTKPPKSWTVLPLGQSDHPESGHWDDQAEKLFGPGKLKPTYFLDKDGLDAHTESVTELFYCDGC